MERPCCKLAVAEHRGGLFGQGRRPLRPKALEAHAQVFPDALALRPAGFPFLLEPLETPFHVRVEREIGARVLFKFERGHAAFQQGFDELGALRASGGQALDVPARVVQCPVQKTPAKLGPLSPVFQQALLEAFYPFVEAEGRRKA